MPIPGQQCNVQCWLTDCNQNCSCGSLVLFLTYEVESFWVFGSSTCRAFVGHLTVEINVCNAFLSGTHGKCVFLGDLVYITHAFKITSPFLWCLV